jgi:hypothetical protein
VLQETHDKALTLACLIGGGATYRRSRPGSPQDAYVGKQIPDFDQFIRARPPVAAIHPRTHGAGDTNRIIARETSEEPLQAAMSQAAVDDGFKLAMVRSVPI